MHFRKRLLLFGLTKNFGYDFESLINRRAPNHSKTGIGDGSVLDYAICLEFELRAEIEPYRRSPLRYVSNAQGSIVLMRSSFAAFEGEIHHTPFTKIGLNIGRTGRLYRASSVGVLNSDWRRNGVTVNLPNDPAVGSSSAVTMIGLAIDFSAITRDGETLEPSALEKLANKVTIDTHAADLLRNLFTEAELHGSSTAFFDSKLDALLRRLTTDFPEAGDKEVSPLDEFRLAKVCELIHANVAGDLSVQDMADCAQMDASHFTKKFQRATGVAPFAFLSAARMERAKSLLRSGMSVTAVAFQVGYNNPSKFSAAFRRINGVQPSQWKKDASR